MMMMMMNGTEYKKVYGTFTQIERKTKQKKKITEMSKRETAKEEEEDIR